MSVPLLEALADAIYAFEGNKPGDRAYRNRNPGNLRPQSADQPRDAGGYRVFATFVLGYNALLHDLADKILGNNAHGLTINSTIEQLLQVYAPRADGNRPHFYAVFVAAWLSNVYNSREVSIETPFSKLYLIAREAVPGGVVTA